MESDVYRRSACRAKPEPGGSMHIRRSRWLMPVAALFAVVASFAHAQDFSAKPIRIVVGVPPGGPLDITARVLADGLRARLNQTVIVDNKPGASTLIAARDVVSSNADGYTLLLGTQSVLTY